MKPADIIKLVSNVVVATAFLAAAVFSKIPWVVALLAMALLLTPSSLPDLAKLLLTKKPPEGASVIEPSDDEKGPS